jgi:hypothetical protein
MATNPIILHDNARAHTADAVKNLLRSWRWEILELLPQVIKSFQDCRGVATTFYPTLVYVPLPHKSIMA